MTFHLYLPEAKFFRTMINLIQPGSLQNSGVGLKVMRSAMTLKSYFYLGGHPGDSRLKQIHSDI